MGQRQAQCPETRSVQSYALAAEAFEARWALGLVTLLDHHHMSKMTITRAVPFGGVCGWLADVTIPDKLHRNTGAERCTRSFFSAEPEEYRALAAVRCHAKAGGDASIVLRRALSRREVTLLRLKSGEVRPAYQRE